METSSKPSVREDMEDLEPPCRTGDSEHTMAARGSQTQRNVCSGRPRESTVGTKPGDVGASSLKRPECSQHLSSWSPSTGRIPRTVHSPTAGAHTSRTWHGGMLCKMVQTKRPDPTKPSAESSGLPAGLCWPDAWLGAGLHTPCWAVGGGSSGARTPGVLAPHDGSVTPRRALVCGERFWQRNTHALSSALQ